MFSSLSTFHLSKPQSYYFTDIAINMFPDANETSIKDFLSNLEDITLSTPVSDASNDHLHEPLTSRRSNEHDNVSSIATMLRRSS